MCNDVLTSLAYAHLTQDAIFGALYMTKKSGHFRDRLAPNLFTRLFLKTPLAIS